MWHLSLPSCRQTRSATFCPVARSSTCAAYAVVFCPIVGTSASSRWDFQDISTLSSQSVLCGTSWMAVHHLQRYSFLLQSLQRISWKFPFSLHRFHFVDLQGGLCMVGIGPQCYIPLLVLLLSKQKVSWWLNYFCAHFSLGWLWMVDRGERCSVPQAVHMLVLYLLIDGDRGLLHYGGQVFIGATAWFWQRLAMLCQHLCWLLQGLHLLRKVHHSPNVCSSISRWVQAKSTARTSYV